MPSPKVTTAVDEHKFYRIACKVCFSKFDVRRVHGEMLAAMSGVAAVHCVYCGAPSLQISPMSSISMWREIAIEKGMGDTDIAEQLVHALWDAWEPTSGDPPTFGLYLEQVLADLNVPTKEKPNGGS